MWCGRCGRGSGRCGDLASNAGIYWIASYPRSGNTWMRFLLTAYLKGPAAASGEVAAFVPDLHVPGARIERPRIGERRFIKTHYLCSSSHPHVDATRAAIVLVRHPASVALSSHALRCATEASTPDGAEKYVRLFVANGGDAEWSRLGFGDWASSIASWLDAGDGRSSGYRFPIIMVRYEDLLDDTARELARVLAFLGEARDPERIRMVVAACSFEAMREREAAEKERGASAVFAGTRAGFAQGHRFVASARRAVSLGDECPGLDVAASPRFAGMMRRLGYV